MLTYMIGLAVCYELAERIARRLIELIANDPESLSAIIIKATEAPHADPA